jgi:hypothetical protein
LKRYPTPTRTPVDYYKVEIEAGEEIFNKVGVRFVSTSFTRLEVVVPTFLAFRKGQDIGELRGANTNGL